MAPDLDETLKHNEPGVASPKYTSNLNPNERNQVQPSLRHYIVHTVETEMRNYCALLEKNECPGSELAD